MAADGNAPAAPPQPCRWCGDGSHGVRCPWVKAFEFDHATGQVVTRVEFMTPRDYAPARPEHPDDSPGEEYPKLGPSGGNK